MTVKLKAQYEFLLKLLALCNSFSSISNIYIYMYISQCLPVTAFQSWVLKLGSSLC